MKKHNQSLPGQGGVFNVINLNLYHYAGNNPIKYTDPDGKIANFAIGAAIGFISSTAAEVIPRMVSGQSFGDALYNTFSDPKARTNIAVSMVLGAVTSGASSLATKGVTSVAQIAATNMIVNTAGGAVDASAKDVIGKAVTGEKQNFGETAIKTLEGTGSALLFSGVTEGGIAANTTKSANIANAFTKTLEDVKVTPPSWSGAAGITGETILPTTIETMNTVRNNINENE